MPRTLTLILNWNSPADTILVADDVLRNHDASVVIIDNHSSDNSLTHIAHHYAAQNRLTDWHTLHNLPLITNNGKAELHLVALDKNYGFAGGINRVLKQTDTSTFEFTWLLNNDAIPGQDALSLLEKALARDNELGFAGSLIADYYDRSKIQCTGVRYLPALGISKLVLKNRNLEQLTPEMIRSQKIDFQHGSSLLVRNSCMDKIGLMDERYFLYFEEQDWQYRGERAGYKNSMVPESIVFHKGSMSTQHSRYLFFYYYNMSAVLYSLKHNIILYKISAFFFLGLISVYRTKLNPKSLKWAFKGILQAWRKY